METTERKAMELCEIKDRLVSVLNDQVSGNLHNANANELGQVADMIKDLAKAEEKMWKSCYYKTIIHAMHEEHERMEHMPQEDRMGYDHYRYSSGRFAPKGHGHYSSGYRPMEETWAEGMHMEPWMSEYEVGSQNRSAPDRYGYTPTMRGMKYDNYHKAKMGYHESKDAHSKEQMDNSAREYVVDTAESIREMWKEADPTLRKEIKNRLTTLANEMN